MFICCSVLLSSDKGIAGSAWRPQPHTVRKVRARVREESVRFMVLAPLGISEATHQKTDAKRAVVPNTSAFCRSSGWLLVIGPLLFLFRGALHCFRRACVERQALMLLRAAIHRFGDRDNLGAVLAHDRNLSLDLTRRVGRFDRFHGHRGL